MRVPRIAGSALTLAAALAAVATMTIAGPTALGRGTSVAAAIQTPHHSRSAGARPAGTQEFVVGAPVERNGLEIAANYLLGIQLDLDSLMPMAMGGADAIHLEADVHAAAGNPHGFDAGDWIPYLGVGYHVAQLGSDWAATGTLLPMVAKDGPHYAANTRLNGPGQYRVTYHLDPPIAQGFFRHTDPDTGVAAWWEPFEVSWTFSYPSEPKD
jgi:periplasmic iron binding protein